MKRNEGGVFRLMLFHEKELSVVILKTWNYDVDGTDQCSKGYMFDTKGTFKPLFNPLQRLNELVCATMPL